MLLCGHTASGAGLMRRKGKDWQFCTQCELRNDGLPPMVEVHANADYSRYKVPRGTGSGTDLPNMDEPLF